MRTMMLAIAGLIACVGGAHAQEQSAGTGRAPNEVLVLGTSHLSGWPDDVPLANLDPLIDRLAAWQPRMIAIESIPGDQCYLMRRQPEFADTAKDFCPDTEAAFAATGLDVPQAIAERARLLAALPETPSAAERRHLAAVMLASGDPTSAVVQWLYLPESERHAGDGIDSVLADRLDRLMLRRNENYALSARLAVRLGLQEVVQMDDQGVSLPIDDGDAYGAAISAAWAAARVEPTAEEVAARGPGLYSAEGVLEAYRLYNAPDYPAKVYASDFGATLAEPSAGQYGRMYVTYWETRNLRMAANIREAFGAMPGSRMLVIVGASHKGYLDRYLGMMRDVSVADAMAVLK
ncbi:MAG: hypothetical protein CMN73_13960 [Sphingomonas sp.]|nr:hypothetical protein [Sphingomonas sp.]